MQQTISGADGRYFYAIPQTQSEIELAHKGTVPFFCFHFIPNGMLFDLCIVVPRTAYFQGLEIETHQDFCDEGGIETTHSLKFRHYEGRMWIEPFIENQGTRTCPLLIPISELPFDMGLLIQLIEKSPTFQNAMSKITQIELIEAEYVNN